MDLNGKNRVEDVSPGEEASSDSALDASAIRSQLFSALADVESDTTRNSARLTERVDRLERIVIRRASLMVMNEEMKTFLVMTGISVAAALLVPLVQAWIEKWRRSQ